MKIVLGTVAGIIVGGVGLAAVVLGIMQDKPVVVLLGSIGFFSALAAATLVALAEKKR